MALYSAILLKDMFSTHKIYRSRFKMSQVSWQPKVSLLAFVSLLSVYDYVVGYITVCGSEVKSLYHQTHGLSSILANAIAFTDFVTFNKVLKLDCKVALRPTPFSGLTRLEFILFFI